MTASSIHHPFFARLWTRMVAAEGPELVALRSETLAGLRGDVLELGAGTGANFERYPAEVSSVLAVEPEPYLRERAQAAAAAAPIAVTVVDGAADALPAEDGRFDAAVTSLVLCSVPDQRRALAELRRVLRPGGELRFLEHVHAETGPRRPLFTALDRTVWPRLGGGCHLTRHTDEAIAQSGFAIEACRRLDVRKIPHVLGRARRDERHA